MTEVHEKFVQTDKPENNWIMFSSLVVTMLLIVQTAFVYGSSDQDSTRLVKALETENSRVLKQNQERQAEIAALKEKNVQIEKQSQQKEQQHKERETKLSKEVTTLKSIIMSEGDVYRLEVSALNSDLDKAKQRINDLKTKNKDLDHKCTRHQKENDQLQHEIQSLVKRNGISLEQSELCRQQSLQSQEELKTTKEDYQKREKEWKERQSEMDSENTKIQQRERELESENQRLNVMNAELSTMNEQKQLQISNLKMQMSHRNRELIDQMTEQMVQSRIQEEKLENDKLEIQLQLDECRRTAMETDDRILQLMIEQQTMQREQAHVIQELEGCKNREIEWEQDLSEAKEREIVVLCIAGAILLVIAMIIFVMRWRGKKKMAENMDQALDEQRKRILKVDAPVPVIWSVHADRLGVHEHPAVRARLGMKKPYDVTAGEGFHVSRITETVHTATAPAVDVSDDLDLVSGAPVSESQNGDESKLKSPASLNDLCEILNI